MHSSNLLAAAVAETAAARAAALDLQGAAANFALGLEPSSVHWEIRLYSSCSPLRRLVSGVLATWNPDLKNEKEFEFITFQKKSINQSTFIC